MRLLYRVLNQRREVYVDEREVYRYILVQLNSAFYQRNSLREHNPSELYVLYVHTCTSTLIHVMITTTLALLFQSNSFCTLFMIGTQCGDNSVESLLNTLLTQSLV